MYIPNAPRNTYFTCGNPNHIAIDCRKNKQDRKQTPKSEFMNKSVSVRYKPENPCFHCASLWHLIYTCKSYHDLYHNYYEPLPKFYKKVNSDKCASSSQINVVNLNSDKKNSAAKINKINKKGSKQVWILKTSNQLLI